MNSLSEFQKIFKQIDLESKLDEALWSFYSNAWDFEPTAEDRRTYVYRYLRGPRPISPDDESELLAWLDRVYDEAIQLHELHFGRLHGGKGGE